MTAIDIRTDQTQDIDEVVFGGSGFGYASRLKSRDNFIRLEDYMGNDQSDVKSEDIDNLILALQKAKELGW